jgi:hypothetical protein
MHSLFTAAAFSRFPLLRQILANVAPLLAKPLATHLRIIAKPLPNHRRITAHLGPQALRQHWYEFCVEERADQDNDSDNQHERMNVKNAQQDEHQFY